MIIDLESPFEGNALKMMLTDENWIASDDQPSQGAENWTNIITFSPQLQDKIYAPEWSSVIVKVIGKSFGYKNLLTRLGGIWKPKGNFSMIDLGYDFFLVKFSTLEDYQKALK